MATNTLPVNRFTNMEFPDYEFVEFPKWVTPADGKAVLVQTEAEEAAVMGGEEIVREDDVRADLVAEATLKAVKFDKRWSLERIRNAIDDHDKRAAAAKAV